VLYHFFSADDIEDFFTVVDNGNRHICNKYARRFVFAPIFRYKLHTAIKARLFYAGVRIRRFKFRFAKSATKFALRIPNMFTYFAHAYGKSTTAFRVFT
jgi:hypothetical protein